MSAPFPHDPHAEAFAPQSVVKIKDRPFHIPTFYKRHEDPAGIVVKQDGLPLLSDSKREFTVADVPPERRWAIRENGEIISKDEFKRLLTHVREEWFRLVQTDGKEVGQVPPHWNPNREKVPSVRQYVSVMVDPRKPSRLIPMHYDPNATRGARPDTLYDKDGENPISGDARIEILCHQYAQDKTRLLDHERKEVEAHLGIAADAGTGGVVAKIEELTSMFTAGEITDSVYAKRVAALTGKETVAVEGTPAVAESVSVETEEVARSSAKGLDVRSLMPCGLKVHNTKAQRHQQRCEKCQEVTG
jgi:hypothetical protein